MAEESTMRQGYNLLHSRNPAWSIGRYLNLNEAELRQFAEIIQAEGRLRTAFGADRRYQIFKSGFAAAI